MSDQVTLPVLISGLATKVDGSIKISLETRDLGADHAAKLFSLRNQEAWILLQPNEIKEEDVKLPNEKADTSLGTKTPSQRMRAIIYRLWEQSRSGTDFESFYRITMEKMNDQLKEKLND